MKFVKMHGLGNDFIIVDNLDGKCADAPRKSQELCRRHFSVGADGLVLIQDSDKGDYRMRIYNPDGSEPEMCGNALRCVALYARKYLGAGEKLLIETGAGLLETKIVNGDYVRVNMGKPELRSDLVPVTGPRREILNEEISVQGKKFFFAAVSMGNPHCVIFMADSDDNNKNIAHDNINLYGPVLEKHSMFPNHTNVEFVRVTAQDRVEVKVWERGAGATLACGTGACAVVVAGVMQKRLHHMPVEVVLPGGSLYITWQPGEDVYMEGPGVEVFKGQI